MSEASYLLDWATLAVAPTQDVEELRRAYRVRLKVVGPESDPAGFQLLRQAFERLLVSLQTSDAQAGESTNDSNNADRTHLAVAQPFIDALHGLRVAGDQAGALALAQKTLGTHLPGSAALEAIEDALMDQVAFDRRLSPPLFILLVNHFDWRDMQGRVAQNDPERHAALLDRIGAEDWMAQLAESAKSATGTPGGQVAALMLAGHAQAFARLKADGLQAGSTAEVRTQFDELLTHASFVLNRFDGATLALLREAVEGPPLLGEPHVAAPVQPVNLAGVIPPVSKQNRLRIRIAVALVVVGMVGGRMLWKSDNKGSTKLPDTSLAATMAAPMLKDPTKPWLATRTEPGGIYVDWAPILKMRQAVGDLRIGINVDEPASVMNLPEWDAPIGFVATKDIKYITMRVRYKADGEWSEVRRYPIWEGRP